MINRMKLEMLDYWLVPAGVGILAAYHLWLLRRIMKQPIKTLIGIHAINRRFWVHTMMEDNKNGVLAVQTLRNNIMASTLLASTAIMLSSVIAVLMTPTHGNGTTTTSSSSSNSSTLELVVGNRSPLGYSIKFFSILVCFLLAFLLNVQSIRYYSHASILVNVPTADKIIRPDRSTPRLTRDYVARIVNWGGYFWSLGLRAFYFSFPLVLWVFGPIPMFVSCVLMVFLLYFLDSTSHFEAVDPHHHHHVFKLNDSTNVERA